MKLMAIAEIKSMEGAISVMNRTGEYVEFGEVDASKEKSATVNVSQLICMTFA